MNFIPSAFAYGSGAHANPSALSSLWVLAVFLVFIYFLMWRPQATRIKKHRAMIASLQKGDEVITSGGVLGRIVSIDDHTITLTIAENTNIKLQKNSINSVLPKGTLKF